MCISLFINIVKEAGLRRPLRHTFSLGQQAESTGGEAKWIIHRLTRIFNTVQAPVSEQWALAKVNEVSHIMGKKDVWEVGSHGGRLFVCVYGHITASRPFVDVLFVHTRDHSVVAPAR